MGLESTTVITGLDAANPIAGDDVSEGDNHFRLLKTVLLNCFPNTSSAFYKHNVQSKAANYTLVAGDSNSTIYVTATPVTITLPVSTGLAADFRARIVARVATPTITIQRNASPGTDTIIGATSMTLTQDGEAVEIEYRGSGAFELGYRSQPRSTVKFNGSNDIIGARWAELTYSASSQTVASTLVGLASGLLGSDYFLRTTDNAGNVRHLKRPTVQVFTSSGTWTKPAGCTAIDVVCVGGGGAGGGAAATSAGERSGGGGGGGGGTAIKYGITSASSTETVTIGSGGTGVSGGAGNSGNNSTFGAHVTGGGGNGGAAMTGTSAVGTGSLGGAGGTGTSGDVNLSGSNGGSAFAITATAAQAGGGGSSSLGNGTLNTGQASGGITGAAGPNYGSGGQGSMNSVSQSARAGGAGAAGIIIVYEYYD